MTHLVQHLAILFLTLTISTVPCATAQTPDLNAQACQTAAEIISICVSVNPALSTATAFSSTASCACYSSHIWAPGVFDNYHASCYDYYSTASPEIITQATSWFHGPVPSNPCAQAGNVLSVSSTATETTLNLPQTTEAGYAPCLFVQSVASSCGSDSPILSSSVTGDEASRLAASCLCYGGAGISSAMTAWKPMVFDNSWSACINYFKTENPVQYTSITASPGFEITPCAKAGDVRSLDSISSAEYRTSSLVPTPTSSVANNANSRVVECSSDWWKPFLAPFLVTGLLNCGLM